jgi:glucokinase
MATYGGLDLGGTKIQAVVTRGPAHKVMGQARMATPREGGPRAVVEALVACMREASSQAQLSTEKLAGVGLGSPGEVDSAAGTVARAGNLSEWEAPFPVAAALSEQLGARVAVGNDVDVATRAEFRLGAGRDASSLLGVFWGTGVGGGLILDGKPWHGRGAAGEIGHMVVVLEGARCPCGRRGCMEAYAGRRAMEAKALREVKKGHKTELFTIMKHKGHDALSSSVWAKALEREDKLAVSLIDRAVGALGAGVASAVNLLDVELVVLGGGLGLRFGAPMVERIEHAMRPHLFNDSNPPRVRLAELGDLGGAVGAALIAAHKAPAASRRR